MKKLSIFLCVIALLAGGFYVMRAQQASPDAFEAPPDRGAAGVMRLLRSLQTRASLVLFTAHPDDEDGGMLAYEARGLGARAALMTLNRGEGGQNVMSTDLYDALGLIRTQELLVADRYMGVDQYFGTEVDYGFSKTREEALEKWGHDRVLSDAVRVIRMVRPLVVASVFVGAATDGHGNHQVAGEVNQEAYLAAGDPTKFPEQIREGLRPWSPLKVYARVAFFQVTAEGMYDYAIDKFVPVRFFDYVTQKWSDKGPTTTLEIPEGTTAPAMGLTYLQIAREGLGFQKTQNGGGTLPIPTPFNSGYHRYGSRVEAKDKETSFFDGIDTSVEGIASLASGDTKFLKDGLAGIAQLAASASKEYDVDHPAAIAPQLANGLTATRDLIAQLQKSAVPDPGRSDVIFELRVKESQFQKALAASLDISFQTTVVAEEPSRGRGRGAQSSTEAAYLSGRGGRGGGPTFTIAIPGQSFGVDTQVFNEGPEKIDILDVSVSPSDGKNWIIHPTSKATEVKAGALAQWKFDVSVPADASFTRPYFSRPDEEQPYYDLIDPRYRNLPASPYPLSARARLLYRHIIFDVAQDVQTTERVPGIGLLQNPLLVAPAISVSVTPAGGAVPIESKSFAFACTVHSNVKGPARGKLHLELPAGWRSNPAEAQFSFARDGEDQAMIFSVAPDVIKQAAYTITAVAEYDGHSYAEGYHLAGYPGVRPYPFYRPAKYKAVGMDVKTAPGLHVGFLPGTGDDVPKALENLGVNVRVLATSDLTHGDLSVYDSIILGTRAYAVRQDLKSANARLLDYVKNGGVLIVQYNLQDFDHDYGPYPFVLGANPQKVVDENTPVTILDPNNPALSWPNHITAADFNGWVEERGHGFLHSWDSRYEPLLEVHDPDQDPQKGGLLLARYGKGYYIYDAFALYRQLPNGVPGAFRILANLASLAKNPVSH